MGLEIRVRELVQNLLVWREGCINVNFRNFPMASQMAGNCENFRVDVSGCTA